MVVERIEYSVDGIQLVGHLALPDTKPQPRPGVVLMHEALGQDHNVRARAGRLAALGYVAFALDYLGGGIQHSVDVSMTRLGELREDTDAIRALAVAGCEILASRPEVDSARLAAVGFCFGGAMALELGRARPELRAIVGFHPGFVLSRLDGSTSISANVLMFCGAEDPVVSAEDRACFEADMRRTGVADWQLVVYGGVGHSFTNPDIGSRDVPPGIAYDARADRRSWSSMLDLFDDVLAPR